jgi:glycine/D-amino acid oxidase-like deaminating enzyme
MVDKVEYDYLIVGQGLAGSILAEKLLRINKRILVLDDAAGSSSQVAAGVINPMVLKRLTVSWRAKEFLDHSIAYFKDLNEKMQAPLYMPLPLYKVIYSADERNFWKQRYQLAALEEYITQSLCDDDNLPFKKGFKLGMVKRGGWVNFPLLLEKIRNVLTNKQAFVKGRFEHSLLETESGKYKDIAFKKIVFCEGAAIRHNPFFNYLPLTPNKGEIITVQAPAHGIKSIYKKKVFILPIDEDHLKVGATYAWQWQNEEGEEEKGKLLMEQVSEWLKIPMKMGEHTAGIRPSVKDRRPLLGQHPEENHMFIFNGLGSRGGLMAPLLAKELIEFMEKGKPLNREADIRRFKPD